MTTLLRDDLDMDTLIRRLNLRTAWRFQHELKSGELAQLIEACRLEWGEDWLTEVLS